MRIKDSVVLQEKVIEVITKVTKIKPYTNDKPNIVIITREISNCLKPLLQLEYIHPDEITLEQFNGLESKPSPKALRNINKRLSNFVDCGMTSFRVQFIIEEGRRAGHPVAVYITPDWEQFNECDYLFNCRDFI